MAKKRSQLERAIQQIDDDIAALELARAHLVKQRAPAKPAVLRKPLAPKPRPVEESAS